MEKMVSLSTIYGIRRKVTKETVVGVFYTLPSQEDRVNKVFIKKLEEVPSSQALLLMLGLEPL